jgi:CYTH domain-containing protein
MRKDIQMSMHEQTDRPKLRLHHLPVEIDRLEKQRFFVEGAGAMWHVDVYCGLLQGTVLAEVELKEETQKLTLPAWVGKEVTGDPFYRKINMRARALNASAAAASIQFAPAVDPGPI